MLNISVVSFYDNFGLAIAGSEEMATKGIENSHWPLSTTPPSIDASSCENRREYSLKLYITGNIDSLAKLLSLTVWKYLHCVLAQLSPKARPRNLVKPTMKTHFSIKWHLKVIQGQVSATCTLFGLCALDL